MAQITDIPVVVCSWMDDPNVAILCNQKIFAADGLVSMLKEHPEIFDEILCNVVVLKFKDYDPMKFPEPKRLTDEYVPISERQGAWMR